MITSTNATVNLIIYRIQLAANALRDGKGVVWVGLFSAPLLYLHTLRFA